MSSNNAIALDAMGGDGAPHIVISGAAIAARKIPDIRFLFFGDENVIAPLIADEKILHGRNHIIHTDQVIDGNTEIIDAVRRLKRSSMRLAIGCVRDKKAAAVVCAGNTGALMAISKIELKTLRGVLRPAIAGFFPTMAEKPCLVLDLGANAESDAKQLVQFSLMGEIYARHVLNITNPSIGLLNIGSEDVKGHPQVREAARILREEVPTVHFTGFVEGNDLAAGRVDVAVTDGFSGNIMLKSIEGYTQLYFSKMRHALRSSWSGRIFGVFLIPALRKLRASLDPRRYNGAMFLGLNGIVVKSHGSTDAFGFAQAIDVAYRLVKGNFNRRLSDEFEHLHATPPKPSKEPPKPMKNGAAMLESSNG